MSAIKFIEVMSWNEIIYRGGKNNKNEKLKKKKKSLVYCLFSLSLVSAIYANLEYNNTILIMLYIWEIVNNDGECDVF